MSFTSLEARGFAAPTPIQGEAIPAVLAKRDVLGIAKTGSGKTAGYVLPILHHLQSTAPRYREPSVLVLVLVLVPDPASVPAGILTRLRKLVQNIKTRPGYTEAIGLDWGIISTTTNPVE